MATRTNNHVVTNNTQQFQPVSVAQQLLIDFKLLWDQFITKLTVFPLEIEKIIKSFDVPPQKVLERAKSPVKLVKIESKYNQSHIQQQIRELSEMLDNQKKLITAFLQEFIQTFKLNNQDHNSDLKVADIVKNQSSILQQQQKIELPKSTIHIISQKPIVQTIKGTSQGSPKITPKDSPVKQTQSMIQTNHSNDESPDRLYQTQMYRLRSETQFEDVTENCMFCKQQIQDVGLFLNCEHVMHEQCFINLLQQQLQLQQVVLSCICKQKISTGAIRRLIKDKNNQQQILDRLCSLQLKELQRKFASKISGYLYWTKESVDQGLLTQSGIKYQVTSQQAAGDEYITKVKHQLLSSKISLINLELDPNKTSILKQLSRKKMKFNIRMFRRLFFAFSSKTLVPRDKLECRYSRSSGPGGQHVNKTNSKAEIRFNIHTCDWLNDDQKKKFLTKHHTIINNIGEVIITSQFSRCQDQNLSAAIDKLQVMVDDCSRPDKAAFVIPPPTENHIKHRLESKRKRSDVKRNRSMK